MLHHEWRVRRLGVQSRSDRRAANPEIAQGIRGAGHAVPVALDGVPVGGELLAEANRRGVLQVCAPGLENAVECSTLRQEGGGQPPHGVEERGQLGERGQPDGRRDHVVG